MNRATRRAQARLRVMYDRNGVIVRKQGAQILNIHRDGDRRTRPIACIEAVDVKDWLERGIIELGKKGYALTAQASRRILNGVPLHDVLAQRSLMPPSEPSTQRRRARRLDTIDRLERKTHPGGGAVYSHAQIMAARRFERAVQSAGEGRIATSDTAAPKVDGGFRAGRVEDAAILRLDAARALARAKAGLDPRIARTLTRVIGADVPLGRLEREEGWSPGIAAMLLGMGLDHLVNFYGTQPGGVSRAERRTG